MEDYFDKEPTLLSGSQNKSCHRGVLAMTPKIVILDERHPY